MITLEDVALQLGLPVDGSCVLAIGARQLLGKVPDKFSGSQINFSYLENPSSVAPKTNQLKISRATKLGIRYLDYIVPRDVSGN
ncbi:serine/threonine-protein phosphatase 7 long form-like protein [Gossypium australe]|uniref:Serine/threonine-protein phosphatase 7 long form-like protein n=1 Tax=Gossypium australe TaxID=47621 RepID=A0A5B6VTL3_9ROSI|nr:serine/threonine-protein phosphatase 7 long form-like protein [Gossypium australe]